MDDQVHNVAKFLPLVENPIVEEEEEKDEEKDTDCISNKISQ